MNEKNIVLIGAGGHARSVLAAMREIAVYAFELSMLNLNVFNANHHF